MTGSIKIWFILLVEIVGFINKEQKEGMLTETNVEFTQELIEIAKKNEYKFKKFLIEVEERKGEYKLVIVEDE